MEKLNFFGIGPKIGRIALPFLAVAIVVTILFPDLFSICASIRQILLIGGIVLMAVALIFYFSTLKLMLPGIKENRLITSGAYKICRNPLYTALILFFIPGLGLAMNSWIIPITSILAYLAFRKTIHEEEEQLERIFGDEYRTYRKRTPRFCPFGRRG